MNFFNETGTYENEVKKTFDKTSIDTNAGIAYGNSMNHTSCDAGMMMEAPMCGQMPIYECPQERVCHRYICHEVPHVMPCNTRIVNHHVFRHTFTPEYTCCEENVCENVYGPRCC